MTGRDESRALSQLRAGETARIVSVSTREPERMIRLSALGLVPGARVTLEQRHPATVLRIGETTVALDPDIASEIRVERL